jgi:tetratricopeptide (TPR) repeat protein
MDIRVFVTLSLVDCEDALHQAEEAFSQGKWIDASTILGLALDRIETVDIKGNGPGSLTDHQRKVLDVEGRMRVCLGHSLRRMGRFEKGREQFERAKVLAELLQDDRLMADILLGLGFFAWGRGGYSQGKALFWEAIERADRVGATEIKGRAYMGLGNIALVTRRLEEGAAAFKKALEYLEEVDGVEIEMARVMHNQAFVVFKLGKVKEAEEAFKRCISFSEVQGDLSTSGFAHANLAHLYIETDRLPEAERALEKAGHLIARTDDKYGLHLIMWVKGLLRAKKGDLTTALDIFRKVMKGYDEMNLPGQKLHITIDYVPVFLKAGRREELVDIITALKKEYREKNITYLLERLEKEEKDLLGDQEAEGQLT